MAKRRLTPPGFHPAVTIDDGGHLVGERDTLTGWGDGFASGLELWAIAHDERGRPLAAEAKVPRAWQRKVVERIVRQRAERRGAHRLRFEAAAATVLLDVFEGAARIDRALAKDALHEYGDILHRTVSHRLRASMVANLDRVRRLLDDAGRALLATGRQRVTPTTPPYRTWFADGRAEVRLLCQVQDVFFADWKAVFRRLGFRVVRQVDAKRILYRRDDVVAGVPTTFHLDYRQKGEGIFAALHDPKVDGVMFLGHSDWWARVPRNLAQDHQHDEGKDKLLVLVMCFGKHFYNALRERYPRAHIVTTKDPTEDPEDEAMFRHLLDGIAARKTWREIRDGAVADRKTEDNFIYPGDARYVAGVLDEDRDGRLDRFDRFCNVAGYRDLAPATGEDAFVPDPPNLHPRGVDLAPRELDGGKVLEAALMLNSLSYDNQFLDTVNQEQRVVAAGWHVPRPGDFRCTRFTPARLDGQDVVRMSCSVRYARAAQPALTAMAVYEGWQHFATKLRLPRTRGLDAIDVALMGLMLVAHALANADYDGHAAYFRAFVRRYGFPGQLPLARVLQHVEVDHDWESGGHRAIAALRRELSPAQLERLERLLHA